MINWREEGDLVADGLSIWRPGDRSLGFILNLDRLYIYCRYSKKKRKIFWDCAYREPRAWRRLKAKDDYNN
jgi:hypothetical protein